MSDGIEVQGDGEYVPEPKKRKGSRAMPRKWQKKLELALLTVDDLVETLAYSGRKDDDELSVDDMGVLVERGYLTEEMLVGRFREAVNKWFTDMES